MTWTTRPRSRIGGHPAIVAGSGPDVMLLHGVGLRAEAWGAQIDALSSRVRIVAPDMPGHGENTLASPATQLSDYLLAAADVLRALTRPVPVIGHSMGAMVALSLAADMPEHLAGVVALNAVFERDADATRAIRARAGALDGRSPFDPATTLHRWFGDSVSPESEACRDWLCSVDPAAYKNAYSVFAHSWMPNRDMVAAIACPALFMTGADEPNSTPAMSHAMAGIAPLGRAIIVEGAAHMMPMTHAGIVNDTLLDFIAACPA